MEINMSTEKNAMLVVGWYESSESELSSILSPIAERLGLDSDVDGLPNELCEEHSHHFMSKMSRELKATCSNMEIEIVSGANNSESGAWYFGLGIPYISDMPVDEFVKLVTDLTQVMKKSVEGLTISAPKIQNVISWY